MTGHGLCFLLAFTAVVIAAIYSRSKVECRSNGYSPLARTGGTGTVRDFQTTYRTEAAPGNQGESVNHPDGYDAKQLSARLVTFLCCRRTVYATSPAGPCAVCR